MIQLYQVYRFQYNLTKDYVSYIFKNDLSYGLDYLNSCWASRPLQGLNNTLSVEYLINNLTNNDIGKKISIATFLGIVSLEQLLTESVADFRSLAKTLIKERDQCGQSNTIY